MRFVYDGDCSLCTRFAKWAEGKTSAQFVTEADITGVEPEEYAQHAVFTNNGVIHRGHFAIAAVLRTMGMPWKALGHLIDDPVVSPASAKAYRFVADHRKPQCRTGHTLEN